MLWYKAWLETRLRFLICVIGITAICVYNVIRMDSGLTSAVNLAYYYSVLHNATTQLTVVWLLAVNFTTMGGLLREKAVGAASFTLALPFSRAHLAGVRFAVGLAEALAMLAIPWAAIFLTGSVFGKTHSVSQALLHIVFLISGGVVYYAIALLASSVVEGEYTAPVVSFGVVAVIASTFDRNPWNPLGFMNGGDHYRVHEGLLTGAIPWTQIAVYALLAALLVAVSVKAIQMREF